MSDTDSSSYSYSDDFDQAPVTAAPLPALPDSDSTPVPAFQQQHDLPTSTRKASNGNAGVETASQPAAAAPSLTASTHSSRRTAASSPTPETADPIADPATPPAAAAAAQPPVAAAAAAGRRQQRQDAGTVSATATADEVAEIQSLKEENEGLRQQVIGLNNQLNDALNQRGEKVVQITRAPTKQSADADRIQKDIDRLRKLNGKLNDRLRQSDAAGRIVELQNVLNEKLREVETLREDNRSLENVHRNQAKRLATVDEAEARIRTARDHHMEEVRQLKEKIQEYKAQKESDEKLVKKQQAEINHTQMKIRAATQLKVNPKSTAEMEQRLGERTTEIEKLKYQVTALTQSNEGEKKRLREQMKGTSAELRSLQQEAERLRALMAQQDAEPFPSLM